MDKIKFLVVAAVAIVFVITTITAMFGGGRVLDSVLKTYVFRVETCTYKPAPRVLEAVEPEQECGVDYNRTRSDLAGGLAMLLVSLPIAGFAFWQLKKK